MAVDIPHSLIPRLHFPRSQTPLPSTTFIHSAIKSWGVESGNEASPAPLCTRVCKEWVRTHGPGVCLSLECWAYIIRTCSLQPPAEESVRVAHLMDEQEKRDKAIADLKTDNEKLKVTAGNHIPCDIAAL